MRNQIVAMALTAITTATATALPWNPGHAAPDQHLAQGAAGPMSAQEGVAVLAAAVADGTIEQTIADLLGKTPSAKAVSAMTTAMAALTEANPAAAAHAARALSGAALSLAATDPRAALDLASAALAVANDPAVQRAAPDAAARVAVNSAGAVQMARRTAAMVNVPLPGIEAADAALRAVAASEALRRAVPTLATDMADALDLADARVDLAGLQPAAGSPSAGGTPPGAGGTGGGASLPASVMGGTPGNTRGAPEQPGTPATGSGGGGGGGVDDGTTAIDVDTTPLGDQDAASPT